MRILLIGDIYGQTGREVARKLIPRLRKEYNPDWVIANGENTTGGTGLSKKHGDKLFEAGIDVITGGNHIFGRNDWPALLADHVRILRPHNIGGDHHPGKGWIQLEAAGKPPIGVISLAGRVFMEAADCPFRWAVTLISRIQPGIPIIVDFHAEATSEKIAMAWYLDGKVALVAGTHTHVQTSDERILPGGTAAITDIGMTGPRDGILGVDKSIVLERFLKGFSDRFATAGGPGQLEGIVVDIDQNGKSKSITRLRILENE